VSTPEQILFQSRVDELVRQLDTLSTDAVTRALQLMEQTRVQVLDDLLRVPADSFSAWHLRALKAQVDRVVAQLVEQYHRELPAWVTKATDLGVSVAEQPFAAVGVHVGLGFIPGDLVRVLQGYSADLITGLGDEARKRINLVLNQAALGVEQPFEAVQRIAAALPNKSVFRTLEMRAEAIYRTEVNRTSSMATMGRLNQMSERLPNLGKEWVAVDDNRTRPTHFTVAGAFLFNGSPTVVPVSEPFQVGMELAMYPRDPALSAGESVNCRCHLAPRVDVSSVLADIGAMGLV
jgi:hypothetical protein